MNISPINLGLIKNNPKINNIKNNQEVNFSGYVKKTKPVYVIDVYGDVVKFSNVKEAEVKLGFEENSLQKQLKKSEYVGNFAIVDAEKIEKHVVDLEKIKEASKTIKETSLYLVDMYGTYKKYNSLKAAAVDTKIIGDNISAALNKKRLTIGGTVAYRPSEVEILNDDGEIEIDDCRISAAKKILEYKYRNNIDAYKTPFKGEKTWAEPIYLIDIHGRYTKYPSIKGAAERLGICHATLVTAIKNNKGIGDFAVKKASDVEKTYLDEEKIDEIRNNIIVNMETNKYDNNAISNYIKPFIIK